MPSTQKEQWRVTRLGVRFTIKRARQQVKDKAGNPRTFRTRDAAERVARALNG
jgi:hypothetical protein